MATKPLIVIVGPTASGKTAVAIDIATQIRGEVICADSRTVYKGMDIGTAKPTMVERANIPHWGLDLVDPDQRFTVADFKEYAIRKIDEIRRRGHVPIIVGGTGLYVDSVIFDFEFGPEPNMGMRQKFEAMTIENLHKYCIQNNITLPENDKNKRYVIRAIEQKNISKKRRNSPIDKSLIVGITTEKDILRSRIAQRAEKIVAEGVVNEAKILGDTYGWGHESMTGNIYPLCHEYLKGNLTLGELKQKFITLDWRLAKRQITWLKRNQFIHWMPVGDIKDYIVSSLLDSEQKS